MTFTPFAMERYQSTWEHAVELQLSESGVHPVTLAEIARIAGIDVAELSDVALEYVQSNGSDELRRSIAAFHPGSTADGIVVTCGSSEANFLAAWELLGPGDELVFMEPNYFQIHGLADNFGAEVHDWWLDRGTNGWEPDPDRLARLITPRTRAIVVTSPHNPTGARFSEEVVSRIAEIAERHGVWLIADEVYRGAEIDGAESTSFAGRCERLIVTGGLSKAYAAPGLRIGWAVTTPEMAARLWARKDYTTISPSALSVVIAERALTREARLRLLERTRSILRANWPVMRSWLEERADCLDWAPPDAGAIAFVRYQLPIESMQLAEKLRIEQGGLLVPGVHFRTPEYLRIGFGPPQERLRDGLTRLGRVLDPLRATARVGG